MQDIGVMSLLTIISHFVFIALSFNAFQSLRLDRYFTQERQNKFKVAINRYLSIITLNVNGLNAEIKRHRVSDRIKKQELTIGYL